MAAAFYTLSIPQAMLDLSEKESGFQVSVLTKKENQGITETPSKYLFAPAQVAVEYWHKHYRPHSAPGLGNDLTGETNSDLD